MKTFQYHGHRVTISMDGVKRCLDNIYVERLWRSVKYEEVYIKDYQNMNELSISLGRYFHFYNTERFHESLDYRTPDEIYSQVFQHMGLKTQAA
jgi:putative transposase